MDHLTWAPRAALLWALATTPAWAQSPAAADWLPPAAVVQQLLTQQPAVREADAGITAARARAERWRVGPHEWTAKLGIDRRRDGENKKRFTEQEIGLERALRWPGKAEADARLGDLALRVGELARADAWHEAARALLAEWADAVRDARSAQVLAAQAALAQQQLDGVAKRVRAGDAARLDSLAAQADHARAAAAAAQAQSRADTRARTLAVRYPAATTLLHALTQAPPQPASPSLTPEQWVEKILADNHELELAEAQAQLARQHATRAGLERRADPTVGVRATRERGGQESVLGVYVSLPLGGAGRQADAALALAEADQAEQRHALTVQKVQAEAWRTALAAREAEANWRQMEAARAHTQRSAELQARAWSLGEAPLADVLQARRALQDATLAAETARVDALQAQARLLLDTHQLWAAPEHAD